MTSKMYGAIKEGEVWRMKTNEDIKNVLRGTAILKCVKPLRLRRYDRVGRIQNKRIPNRIATATMEGIRKKR
jgi:hypothetical protein